jgi:MFS family permease
MAGTTFLFFIPVSMNALLVSLFDQSGVSSLFQAIVLAAYAVPLLLGNKLLALITPHYRKTHILLLALTMGAAANLLLAADDRHFVSALCARVGQGVAIGLFVPVAMEVAQGQLEEVSKKAMFGLFTAMMPLPATFGPWLGELILRHYSHPVFFLIATLPCLAAAAVVLAMERSLSPDRGAAERRVAHDTAAHTPDVTDYDVLLLSAVVLIIGALSCLTGTYLGPALLDHGVPTWKYFTFSICTLLFVRFAVMSQLAKWKDTVMVGFSLLVMLTACGLVFTSPGRFAIVAGIAYGAAQGVAMPTLALMVNRMWQVKAGGGGFVAFEMLFNLAYLVLPLLFTALSSWVGNASAVLILCFVSAIFVVLLCSRRSPVLTLAGAPS